MITLSMFSCIESDREEIFHVLWLNIPLIIECSGKILVLYDGYFFLTLTNKSSRNKIVDGLRFRREDDEDHPDNI